MKTDFYTKFLLTIIAICLTFLTIQNVDLMPKAYAGGNDILSPKYALVPMNADGTINVNIKSAAEMDVNISDISTNKEFDVNIDEVGGYSTYGEVPVKIK